MMSATVKHVDLSAHPCFEATQRGAVERGRWPGKGSSSQNPAPERLKSVRRFMERFYINL